MLGQHNRLLERCHTLGKVSKKSARGSSNGKALSMRMHHECPLLRRETVFLDQRKSRFCDLQGFIESAGNPEEVRQRTSRDDLQVEVLQSIRRVFRGTSVREPRLRLSSQYVGDRQR